MKRRNAILLAVLLAVPAAGQFLPPPSDAPYGASWNGSKIAPTKNAVYDKIQAVIAGVLDPILADIVAKNPGANEMLYWTAPGTSAGLTTTAWGRARLSDADAAARLSNLGVSAWVQAWLAAADAPEFRPNLGLPYIDPTDDPYGATGDGVTDDTAALQAAIDAAEAAGGLVVLVPPGTYAVSQLTFNNRVVFMGAGRPQSRWNTHDGAVTILGDGTDGTILIAGQADSDVIEGGFEFADGVTLANLYIEPAAGAGRGIVFDGSTVVRATRGAVRDVELHDVHVSGYTDHNIELLARCFDVRFYRCSSTNCGATGVIGTMAASSGATTPGQIYFYDCYLFGNSAGPYWAADGQFEMHGGGVAYGNGVVMQPTAAIYGTHIEGDGVAGGVGLRIMGARAQIITPTIYAYETGIEIGDGTAVNCEGYLIHTAISNATTGIIITDGGQREGMAPVRFYSVATPIDDDRLSVDGVAGSIWNGVANDKFCVTILDDGDWDNEVVPIWQAPSAEAVAITAVYATVLGGGALDYNIEERAWTALNVAGVDIYASDETADLNGEVETSFANAGIAAGNHLVFTTGSGAETPTVNGVQLTIYYRRL